MFFSYIYIRKSNFTYIKNYFYKTLQALISRTAKTNTAKKINFKTIYNNLIPYYLTKVLILSSNINLSKTVHKYGYYATKTKLRRHKHNLNLLQTLQKKKKNQSTVRKKKIFSKIIKNHTIS